MKRQASPIFRAALSEVPKDISLQVDWSWAISDKIHDALLEKGMSQKELAQRMGKTQSEVSRWLSGQHNFNLSTLAKIASALDIDLITI